MATALLPQQSHSCSLAGKATRAAAGPVATFTCLALMANAVNGMYELWDSLADSVEQAALPPLSQMWNENMSCFTRGRPLRQPPPPPPPGWPPGSRETVKAVTQGMPAGGQRPSVGLGGAQRSSLPAAHPPNRGLEALPRMSCAATRGGCSGGAVGGGAGDCRSGSSSAAAVRPALRTGREAPGPSVGSSGYRREEAATARSSGYGEARSSGYGRGPAPPPPPRDLRPPRGEAGGGPPRHYEHPATTAAARAQQLERGGSSSALGGPSTPALASGARAAERGGGSSANALPPARRGEERRGEELPPGRGEPAKCDKCDGPHETTACPWFRKARDRHPDAAPARDKKHLGGSGPVEILRSARVVRQPGDGSCLFHALAYGLRDGSTAHALRRQVASFIESNPTLTISDSPLKDWVFWDSGSSVASYCRRMAQGGVWGGGIEMAAVSHLKRVNVFVYQGDVSRGFKRISSFEVPHATKAVRILYASGVHYDALEARL